ncbi:putative transcription factor B3-Domain family [Helianthus annuus]|uniref:Putative DNA-binding pseudobarrel domain-containing protein n=1 Tax=Helianthus annuus TaxID=4232 RepID=A0A251TKQ0_HELAN|nr:B3 domain-containing protein At3g19184 [Helianthus annuus]KAF5787009.1 putative transcription factor B3-Domain family [Helianthus annuus]KAJ0514324.1 putative transcription factor B3-Domain family [Helianthus annuus]KAJ0530468.1 putative transcription factor B3-Domain family [Helianthus annuus]KAJ0697320.1 putative transcription factor B3-Domain family [Helianthus annuus]KAJ0880206.1 putative transcription factor B3-Domain family [Helianthus annuus]
MVARKNLNYEDSRQKRLEENKKRMEELKLTVLAQSLRTISTPKPSPMKKVNRTPRKPVDLSAVRRSNRVADKPPANYKEVPIETLGIRRSYGPKVRDLSNRVYASDEDREYATGRADELHSTLQSDFPSFVKPMLQSHVSGGFWLGLPHRFSKSYLPKRDEIMTLVDKDEAEWKAKYLPRKTGLSGGWKGFAEDHKLADGDALVFQLIKPTVFKVYIIRVNQAEDSEEA